MAKSIDPARFTRQITNKALEQLNSIDQASRLAEGALVRVKMLGVGGSTKFVQGRVVGYSGEGEMEALEIRAGRRGHFQTLFIPLVSPKLLEIDILKGPGARRFTGKAQPSGKQQHLTGKRHVGFFGRGWHTGSVKAPTYSTRSRAIASVVERAVAETVAEDQAVIIGGIEPATVELAERISSMVADIRDASSNDRIEKLVELMLPASDPVAEVRAKIEVDNAGLRMRFLTEVPALTAAQVAEAAGSKASNKSATANRWKTTGQVFSVTQAGRETFPAFQFDHGAPRPIIGKLLAILQPRRSAWETAFWFVSSNAWLNGAAPVDRLDDEEAVLNAVQRSVEGLAT